MTRRIRAYALAVVLTLTTAACGSALPTYRYAGIDLLTEATGTLDRSVGCIVLTGPQNIVMPIWPSGTVAAAEGVHLPATNGGALLPYGASVTLQGGYVSDARDGTAGGRSARCPGRPFHVSRAQGWYVGTDREAQ